jgi:hypothetical protein
MVYRMTVRSNPRILAIYILIPVIICAGVASFFVFGALYGLIGVAAAAFFAWSLVRLTRRQLATRIETLTDEVLFRLHGDEKILVPWGKVRFAGFALVADKTGSPTRKDRRLFIYNEEEDRLLTLTDEFENMDGLAAELRKKTDFRDLVLAEGETLKEKLRELVGHT